MIALINNICKGSRRRGTGRLLSLVMTVAMITTLFAGLSISASAVTNYTATATMTNLWNGGNPNSASGGTYYSIGSAQELIYLQNYTATSGMNTSGVTFYLTDNINLTTETYTGTWSGIGSFVKDPASTGSPSPASGSTGFSGTLDGAGYTITVDRSESANGVGGVVNYLAAAGTMKNLTIAGSVSVNGTYDAIGGSVGYNAGTINNVTNSATVAASGCYNVGGICGFNDNCYSDRAKGVVANSANAENVTGFAKVGGIAGENSGVIISCSNSGTIVGTNTSSKNGVGGITGRNGNNNTAKEIGRIVDCVNYGTVGSSGQKWVGGIAGFSNALSSVKNCVSVGTIIAGAGYYNPIVGNQEGFAENVYSLSTLNHSSSSESERGVYMTENALKSSGFITTLNSNAQKSTSNADIWETGSDDYPALSYTADIPETEGSGSGNTYPVIYLSSSGDDNNSGASADAPVATLRRAVAIADASTVSTHYISVQDTITIDTDQAVYGNHTPVKWEGTTGPMFDVTTDGNFTIGGLVIDGSSITTGIRVSGGTLTLRNGAAVSSCATAIDVTSTGTLRLNSSTVSGTTKSVNLEGTGIIYASSTQNIVIDGEFYTTGTLTMEGGNLTSQSSSENSDLNIAGGTFTMTGGTISGLTSTSYGPVYVSGGEFIVAPAAASTSFSIDDNVYLASEKYLNVGSSLSGITGTISLTTADPETELMVARGYNSYVETSIDSGKLTSGNSGYDISYNSDYAHSYLTESSSGNSSGNGMELMADVSLTEPATLTGDVSYTLFDGTSSSYTSENPLVVTIQGTANFAKTVKIMGNVKVIGEDSTAQVVSNSASTAFSCYSDADFTVENLTILLQRKASYVINTKTSGNGVKETIKNTIIGSSENIATVNYGAVAYQIALDEVTLDNVVFYTECTLSDGANAVVNPVDGLMVVKGIETHPSDSAVPADIKGSAISINPTSEVSLEKGITFASKLTTTDSTATITEQKGYPIDKVTVNGVEVTDFASPYTISSDTTVSSLGITLADAGPESVTASAYLGDPSKTEIASDGTFTTDVYVKSDAEIASCELNLSAENGTITSITGADGISNFDSSVGNGKLSFYGNTASAAEGLKVATVTVEADGSGNDVTLAISKDNTAIAGVSGNIDDIDMTLGEDASVTVAITKSDKVSCGEYAGGKYLVKYTGDVAEGSIASYNGGNMVYSEKYNAWIVLSDTDVSDTIKNIDVTVTEGTKESVDYSGDVNGNTKVNIVDAQIAYDIANNEYSDYSVITEPMWYRADMNGNAAVEAADARVIQCIIHGITE